MKHIRFHYIELDSLMPFAACAEGETLHVMINAKPALCQEEWVREYLLDNVTRMALNPPPAAQQGAEIIDMAAYLMRDEQARLRSTSKAVTAET